MDSLENFESGLKKTIDWYSKRADTISYQAERIGQNKKINEGNNFSWWKS